MAPITTSIEVERPPDQVFAYITDPNLFGEWQQGVVGGHLEGGDPAVGAKCLTTRRIGFAEREVTSVITDFSPPRSWGVRGVDGPIRAEVNVTVEPLDTGLRSRLTIAVDFEGHGIGKLIVPLAVRRQARGEMPGNLQAAKQRMENGSGS